MASEIQAPCKTGKTLFAELRSSVSQIWNKVLSAFEAYDIANYADYVIPLVEQGTTGVYVGDVPVGVPADTLAVVVKEQTGPDPLPTCEVRASGNIEWKGSAVVSRSEILDRLPDELSPGGFIKADIRSQTAGG